jgi:hypothetical protein
MEPPAPTAYLCMCAPLQSLSISVPPLAPGPPFWQNAFFLAASCSGRFYFFLHVHIFSCHSTTEQLRGCRTSAIASARLHCAARLHVEPHLREFSEFEVAACTDARYVCVYRT